MGLAHNTQRLICGVVLRGCCWLRNTRDSQLARGAAARLLCESGSVATARPCQRTGPCSSLRPNFFALVCPFSRAFFCCCGVKQRSVLGTVAPRVCCLQLVPQRRRPAALRARQPPSEPARRCGRDPTTDTAQMLGLHADLLKTICEANGQVLASLTSSACNSLPTDTDTVPTTKNPDSHSLPLQPAHRTHTCASNT